MEICVPEIIAFYGLGELELAGSIHTVIGGIRSAALSELTSEQKEMVLKMKDWLHPDKKWEVLKDFYLSWLERLHQ